LSKLEGPVPFMKVFVWRPGALPNQQPSTHG
jgi:hypothetical protein